MVGTTQAPPKAEQVAADDPGDAKSSARQAMEILQSGTIPQTGTTHYVVVKGHKPGIYNSFEEFNKQLKNFSGAIGRKAPSLKEAAHILMSEAGLDLYDVGFFKASKRNGSPSPSRGKRHRIHVPAQQYRNPYDSPDRSPSPIRSKKTSRITSPVPYSPSSPTGSVKVVSPSRPRRSAPNKSPVYQPAKSPEYQPAPTISSSRRSRSRFRSSPARERKEQGGSKDKHESEERSRRDFGKSSERPRSKQVDRSPETRSRWFQSPTQPKGEGRSCGFGVDAEKWGHDKFSERSRSPSPALAAAFTRKVVPGRARSPSVVPPGPLTRKRRQSPSPTGLAPSLPHPVPLNRRSLSPISQEIWGSSQGREEAGDNRSQRDTSPIEDHQPHKRKPKKSPIPEDDLLPQMAQQKAVQNLFLRSEDDDHDRRLISLAEENERLLTEKVKILEKCLKEKVASGAGPSAEGKGNAANPDSKSASHISSEVLDQALIRAHFHDHELMESKDKKIRILSDQVKCFELKFRDLEFRRQYKTAVKYEGLKLRMEEMTRRLQIKSQTLTTQEHEIATLKKELESAAKNADPDRDRRDKEKKKRKKLKKEKRNLEEKLAKTKKRLKESLKETELKKKAYDQLEKRCNEAFEKMENRKSLTRLTVCTLTSIDITDQREDKEPLPSTTQEDAKGEGEGQDLEGAAVSSEAGIDKDGVNYSSNTGHQTIAAIQDPEDKSSEELHPEAGFASMSSQVKSFSAPSSPRRESSPPITRVRRMSEPPRIERSGKVASAAEQLLDKLTYMQCDFHLHLSPSSSDIDD